MKKKILITGAFGFIGSHLAELFVRKGYEVIAFDRYNSNNNWGWLEHSKFKNEIEVVLGDIRDYDSVSKAMRKCKVVFHLAALIGIPYSYVSPTAYYKTNAEGTLNVLEASKNLNIEQTIITSTSETYGSAQYIPIDEKHPLVAQSPYAASKIAADQLSISYYNAFNLPVKIVRPFNTYGPRQSLRAIIPTIISQSILEKKQINVGNISPSRDFLHVKDTCNAYLQIYKNKDLYGKIVNVGSGKEISIKNLIEKIISKSSSKKVQIKKEKKRVRPKKSEVNRLLANIKLLKAKTNWKQTISINDGLDETIEWYKKNRHFFKDNIYNI
jgi:NAD dependent epimerase/dehydratase